MKFIRYGSLVPQDHDISDEGFFHTPPVERGIYAFPEGFVEPFLRKCAPTAISPHRVYDQGKCATD